MLEVLEDINFPSVGRTSIINLSLPPDYSGRALWRPGFRLSQSPFLWESSGAENGLFAPAARQILPTRFKVGGVSGAEAAIISNQKPSYHLTSFSWKPAQALTLDNGIKMNVREAINFGLNKLNFENIGENQRKVVEAYLSGRDVLMI